jgi:Ni,Fe-hydrogenase I small subunit
MSSNKLTLGLFAVIFLISCKQDLKVVFPDGIKKEETSVVHKYEIIIYIDGRECTTCSLSFLDSWKLYENILKKYNTSVTLVVLTTKRQDVIDILKSFKINFPVVFDNGGKFRIINDEIFKVAQDGIFVIDRNKNVIFTSSPILNEKKWNSFVKLVKQ